MERQFDIIIIGGGVIGASVAYYLSCTHKYKIALIDKKKPGNASWASAGGLWGMAESSGLGCGIIFLKTLMKVTNIKGDIKTQLKHLRPHLLPQFFLEFSKSSDELLKHLWTEFKETINVDFKYQKTGLLYLFYDDFDKNYAEFIDDFIPEKYKQSVRFLNGKKIHEIDPYVSKNIEGGYQFCCDHQLNPFILVHALNTAAQKNGVTLINEEVSNLYAENKIIHWVETKNSNKIHGDLFINAAGAWSKDIAKKINIDLPVIPIKGEIILTERLPKILNSCFSTRDCYFAQKDHGEILIGSTTENVGFDTNIDLEKLSGLAYGLTRAIPSLNNTHIKRTWSGLRPGSPDELPILGYVDGYPNYINATGHFRTGIVTSAITGKVITELITNQPLSFDLEPYSYNRFKDEKSKLYDI